MTFLAMWLPWNLPIPEGWEVSPHQRLSHHHFYSRLIIRESK